MGWGTPPNTHTLGRNVKGSRSSRLHGFSKKGVTTTVVVDPGTIDGHESAAVIVTILGAQQSKHHVIVAVPPSDLEPGLAYRGAVITGTNQVTITVENTSASPIEAISRNWQATFFSRTGTL